MDIYDDMNFLFPQFDSIQTHKKQSKINLVKESLQSIAGFIDSENSKGSHITMHVITFNESAKVYHQNNISACEFINNISFHSIGSTDFNPPNTQYKKLVSSLLNNNETITSMFISDGNSTYDLDMEGLYFYDYSIGIGSECQVNMPILKSISHDTIRHTTSEMVETVIIQKMFDDINTCYKDVVIEIFLPPQTHINTSLKYTVIQCDNPISDSLPTCVDFDKQILNFKSLFDRDLNVIEITPKIIKKTIKKNVIFIVDISDSMNEYIENDNNFKYEKEDIVVNETFIQSVESIDNLESVFDIETINHWKKYTITIPNIGNTFCEYINVINKSMPIFSQVKYNSFTINHSWSVCLTDKKVKLYHSITQYTAALNRIEQCNNNILKKQFIEELYVVSKNTNTQKVLNDLIKLIPTNSTIHHVFFLLMSKIDKLYGIKNIMPMASISQTLSVNMCKEISQSQYIESNISLSQKEAIDTNNILHMSLNDKNKCIICQDNNRQVVYGCGHIITCTECYLNNDYKTCFECNNLIKHFRIIDSIDTQCIINGCVGIPSILHPTCLQLVYCTPCWNIQKYIPKTQKKRKRLSIECKCKEPICEFIKINR